MGPCWFCGRISTKPCMSPSRGGRTCRGFKFDANQGKGTFPSHSPSHNHFNNSSVLTGFMRLLQILEGIIYTVLSLILCLSTSGFTPQPPKGSQTHQNTSKSPIPHGATTAGRRRPRCHRRCRPKRRRGRGTRRTRRGSGVGWGSAQQAQEILAKAKTEIPYLEPGRDLYFGPP